MKYNRTTPRFDRRPNTPSTWWHMRRTLNITRKALAKKLHRSAITVYGYESGGITPPIEVQRAYIALMDAHSQGETK